MIDEIYNADVLRLAANTTRTEPLAAPDASVTVRSPLCGSSITVEVKVADGKVTDYAHKIKACALGQAAASVMAAQVVGRDEAEIRRVRAEMEQMLKHGGPAPGGDWAALAALEPARAAKARHGAILLPFDAVLKAMAEADAETRGEALSEIKP